MRSNEHEEGLSLAERGKFEESLVCLQNGFESDPHNAELLNDLGVVLYNLGREKESVGYFERSKEIDGKNPQVYLNLVEAYKKIGNKSASVEALFSASKLKPNNDYIQSTLHSLRKKRPKIAYFWGADGPTFLHEIIDYTKHRYQVRVFDGKTTEQIHELMAWSDISWFEWCTNIAVIGSQLPKLCYNIIRLHRYEAYLDWPRRINWDNIDTLITVGNDYVMQALLGQIPDLASKTNILTIPNGVNLEKHKFVERKHGKNLACVGYLNMRKNPMLLLLCLRQLLNIDPEYKLYFAGVFQDSMLEQYVKCMVNELVLENSVIFSGWQGDIASWLADKHYIVSGSIGESQGMGLMEGMAAGLKPIIHNFPGSEQIFPEEFLFNTPEEFCDKVLSNSYDSKKYRHYVEQRYSLDLQLERINDLFIDFEKKKDTGGQNIFIPSTHWNSKGNVA